MGFGVYLRIPEEIELNVCDKCGEHYTNGSASDRIHAALEPLFLEQRRQTMARVIEQILRANIVTITGLGSLVGMSVDALEEARRGQLDVPETAQRLLECYANCPEELRRVARGNPWLPR